MFNFPKDKKIFNQIRSILILGIFSLSIFVFISPLIIKPQSEVGTIFQNSDKNFTPPIISPDNHGSDFEFQLDTILDKALLEWVNTGVAPDSEIYRRNVKNQVVITVFANSGSDLNVLNQNMDIDSFMDLGAFGYIILGSVSSSVNLKKIAQSNPYLKINSDPYMDISKAVHMEYVETFPIDNTPNQFVGNEEMFVSQAHAMDCGGLSCNGTGVTIAIVDGGTDFGNSDLEPALALDFQGFPKSFDTEGWSLVSTPLKIGVDIPISTDNTTILFSQIDDNVLNKLQINDPGDVGDDHRPILNESRGWEYWHQDRLFMAPRDWLINSSWVNKTGQAFPKFGIGVQNWEEVFTGKMYWGYFYALLLDINADNNYESAIIDMETSAWASYLNYITMGGDRTPISQIIPDFDFSNDKIVSWINNSERGRSAIGADYTFAKDWNGDNVNDWSFGSMANAYNRFGFLAVNQSLYGKITNGVDPDGAGFVALHPFAYGFGSHGTWTASNAGSRGIVDYQVFTNRSNSWNFPYGNTSTRKIPGTAPGADIMSVTFGAVPQDSLLSWFWSAGFDLDSNFNEKTVNITGSQWKWSGSVRANITSNSWGVGGLYWSGLWGTDWVTDLLSLPDLGGGLSYIREHQDLWVSQLLGGTSTEQNLHPFNSGKEFQPFTDIFSLGNTLYIGGNNPFVGVGVNITNSATVGFGAGVSTEYFDGTNWNPAPLPSEFVQWNSSGISWSRYSLPVDWKLANFTSDGDSFYWFRFSVTESSLVKIGNLYLEFPNPYTGFPGLLTVVSAGNDLYYQSTANPFGSLSLKVGASSSAHALANQYGPNWDQGNYQMAFFSSAGPKSNGVPGVDVVAPGFYVYSAAPLARSIMGGNRGPGEILEFGGDGNFSFIRWAGTSASSPAAAGVAAIAYQAYIDKNPGVTVNPLRIKQILKGTATNLYYPLNIQGTGLLNASAAVEFIQDPDSSKYFFIGSNITYKEQLLSSAWINTFDRFFWFYAYTPNDEFIDLIEFPVTEDSLLSKYHYDVDLSTQSITKGDIVNTQVVIENNGTGNVAVSAHHMIESGVDSNTILIDNNDHFRGNAGDYQINISIAGFDVWNADYIEIKIKNLEDFDNVTFFVWEDFDGDGYVEMANYTAPETNGAGELGRVQYDSTRNSTYSILKVGNPTRLNTSSLIPMIILRGNPEKIDINSPNWASGKLVEISIQSFDFSGDWSSVVTANPWKTENNISYWNISLNSNGLQAGFHLGYLNFTDQTTGHTQFMPVSFKVSHGQIDNSDPTSNPNAIPNHIGDYKISHIGVPYEIGFREGSMVWVPFDVDESKTNGSDVLAIKVTQLSSGNANFGFVLHYDETPNNFDANWYQILVSPNITGQNQGKNVNWQYIQWDSVGFGSDTAISRFGYLRFGVDADTPIIKYKLGLFITEADDDVNVRVEMYWLSQMPRVSSTVTSTSPFGNSCSTSFGDVCYYSANILYGPNAALNITTTCDFCDPNLPTPTVLFDKVESKKELTTGSFEYGFDSDISIDWWEKREFQAGDLVEFIVAPTEPITDFNLWLFSPETLNILNKTIISKLPYNDTSVIFLSDFLFSYFSPFIGEVGSFIAKESGEYWFGIDNYSPAETNWVVFTKVSRGSVTDHETSSHIINTRTENGFGLDAEATYDTFTDTYDKITYLMVGAQTPTGLDKGFYSIDMIIDNYVAPIVILGELSLKLNGSTVDRSNGSIIFDYQGLDTNGDAGIYRILLDGPNFDDLWIDSTTDTSYTWDFTDPEFTDGWWTIFIWADDSIDPVNTFLGKNYGGLGRPARFRVLLTTSVIITQTSEITENFTRTPNFFEMIGFTTIGAIGGITAVVLTAIVYLRRVEIKDKFNELKVNVQDRINKRRYNEE